MKSNGGTEHKHDIGTDRSLIGVFTGTQDATELFMVMRGSIGELEFERRRLQEF